MESNWSTVKLEEVLEQVIRPEVVMPGEHYKVLGAKWYAKGLFIKSEKDGSEIKAKKLYVVKEGDFVYNRLFAWKGSFAIVPNEFDGCYVSNEFPSFRINTKQIHLRYLFYFFSRNEIWSEVLSLSMGVSSISRNRLKVEKFLSMEIPLSSLEEQKRIVATIGSLMARIEEARRLRAEAVEEVEETVENTHNLIFLKLSQNFGTVQIQQTELDINPENINPKREFGEKSFIYIDVSSVEQNIGKIVEKKNIIGVDAPSRARRKMHKNDVIFSAVRPNLRKCFVVDEKLDGNVCSTGFTTFRIRNNKIEPTFLKYQLLSNFFINQCMNVVTGGHYPAINDKNMKNLEVTFPPLSEQRRIVTYLDLLQAKVDELKRLHAETEKEIEELAPSILDKAFKGEL